MTDYSQHVGKSLEDIIKENKKSRAQKPSKVVRREPQKRDSPYASSSSRSGGEWKHDKYEEAQRKPKAQVREAKPPRPQLTEAERGYKVTISNSPLTEEEIRALLEGSELKRVFANTTKKTATILFANKEEADKAVADFTGKELLDGTGESIWEYVAWEIREPKPAKEQREPREHREPREKPAHKQQGRGQRGSGGKIDANNVVLTVRR